MLATRNLLWSAVFLFLSTTIRTSASNNERVFSMEDLRRLDSYGQSVAMRHATAAADRGNPVAVVVANERIYICSLQDSRLQTIHPRCHLIATGIRGDAAMLCQELQSHSSTIRHRFGTVRKWEQRSIPYIFRRCFEYDEAKALNPPVIDSIDHSEDRYGRPLGIRAVFLEYDECNAWTAQSIDPSGMLQDIKDCFVMGRDSRIIHDRLKTMSDTSEAIEPTLRKALDGLSPLYLDILHKDGSIEHKIL